MFSFHFHEQSTFIQKSILQDVDCMQDKQKEVEWSENQSHLNLFLFIFFLTSQIENKIRNVGYQRKYRISCLQDGDAMQCRAMLQDD